MTNKHIGGDFDDFLRDEGILSDVEAVAVKRVIAWQIEQEMQKRRISRRELAQKMNASDAALESLLNPDDATVTLQTLENAALAIGKRLKVELT